MEMPLPLPPSKGAVVGLRIERGSDWKWGEQDGGTVKSSLALLPV